MKEFNEIVKSIIKIKENIENEINKINNLYEKTMDEVSKSFQKKHEQLLKEENDMKEKLQIEVTKIKEQLEKYLSQSNNEIKINERINLGIKKFENNENNMFKILSYVSKMNKSKKIMNKISKQQLKSLKFTYNEENNNIEYEEYSFNGITISNDIEFKDINLNSLNIYWKIDNYIGDMKEIKYQVEMRKENEDEQFKKIYEGNKTNCLINNILPYTNYQFRIRPIYNEQTGDWIEIKKFETCIGSNILYDIPKKKEFINKLLKWTNSKSLELLYRGTRDGTQPENFHNLCDNKGPTITLFKNEKGNIFGGYASISWKNNGGYQSAPDSFIFTLTNIHNTEPIKFTSKNDKREVNHFSNFGPWFGNGRDIGIDSDFNKNKMYTSFPYTYIDISEKGRSIFTGDFDNSTQYFKIIEVEVFKINK